MYCTYVIAVRLHFTRTKGVQDWFMCQGGHHNLVVKWPRKQRWAVRGLIIEFVTVLGFSIKAKFLNSIEMWSLFRSA